MQGSDSADLVQPRDGVKVYKACENVDTSGKGKDMPLRYKAKSSFMYGGKSNTDVVDTMRQAEWKSE